MSDERNVTLPDVVVTPDPKKPAAGGPAAAGSPGDRGALLLEGYKRGILAPEQRGLVEEGIKRGILKAPAGAAGVPSPAPGAQPVPQQTRPPATTAAPSSTELMQIRPGAAFAPGGGQGPGSTALADAQGRVKAMQAERRAAQGYLPDVDYDSGTNFADAVEMSRRNPAQQRDYLEAVYGNESVMQDKGGRFFIQDKGGKRVSPEGHGFVRGFLADMTSQSPKIAGGTLGGIAGAGVGGPMGAVAGAAAGGAAGEAANQFFMSLRPGGNRGTIPQLAERIGHGGMEMAGAEAGGRAITAIPGALGRAFRSKLADSADPERQQMVAGIERLGGVAPLRTAAPGLTSPIQKVDIATQLGYDPLEAINRKAAHVGMRHIIENSSMPAAEREAAIREMLDPYAAVSSAQSGRIVTDAVKGRVGRMEAEIERLTGEGKRSLDATISNLRRRMTAPASTLGKSVAEEFQAAWSAFSAQAELQYGPIRQLYGDNPVVPTGVIEKKARALFDAMPKTAGSPATATAPAAPGVPIFEEANVVDSVRKLMQLAPKVSFQDAQRIRSKLGSWSVSDVARDLPKHELEELRQAVDLAFDVAAGDPAVAPGVKMLRDADAFYRDGRQKFSNLAINQMVKDLRDGIVPNPETVADKVLREGQLEQAQTMKKLLPRETWERVAGADWSSMMKASTDPQTGQIVSRKLATEIQAREDSGLLDLTYGSRARDMKLWKDRAAAFDEKIPANMLQPGSFGTTMRVLEAQRAQLDTFMKENFLAKLARPGEDADQAARWIARSGHESELVQAEKEFGTASPQMRAIRTQWLTDAIHSAVRPSETGIQTEIAGSGIEAFLKPYTRRELEVLAPGGLADDMLYLARQIKAMHPVERNRIGGQLIAGEIRNLGLLPSPRLPRSQLSTVKRSLGRLVNTAIYDAYAWIYTRPGTVRALSRGLRPGPTQAATRETIRMIFRASFAGMLPEHKDQDVQDPAVGAPTRMPTQGTPSAPGRRSSAADDYYRGRGYQVPEISALA